MADEDKSEREAIRNQRRAMKRSYRDLHGDLVRLLIIADPLWIRLVPNEYEPEVGTILPRLPACKNEEDVARVLIEEFDRWFYPGAFSPALAAATATLVFRTACYHGVCERPGEPHGPVREVID